jgi:hypothetical protein
MRSSKAFAWLPESPVARHGPLDVLFRGNGKTVYSHLHFSVYGKFQKKKTEEAAFISELARSVA